MPRCCLGNTALDFVLCNAVWNLSLRYYIGFFMSNIVLRVLRQHTRHVSQICWKSPDLSNPSPSLKSCV